MSSIRSDLVAIDTNVFLFAIRAETLREQCAVLVFDRLCDINVFVPLEVHIEIQRNLTARRDEDLL